MVSCSISSNIHVFRNMTLFPQFTCCSCSTTLNREREGRTVTMERRLRFCKTIKTEVPKYLEIPGPFFRDSMTKFVVLHSVVEGKQCRLEVEKWPISEHRIKWRKFASENGISAGDSVHFTSLHSNHIRVEVYSPSGHLKNVQRHEHQEPPIGIESESEAEELMEERFQHYSNNVQRRRSTLFGSSRSSGSDERKYLREKKSPALETSRLFLARLKAENYHGQLHWFRNCSLAQYAPGTEGAIRKAAVFQRKHLQNPSLLVVLPVLTIIGHGMVHFTRAFVHEYCPWKNQEIQLEDKDHQEWTVGWISGSFPKINSRFQKFASAHRLKEADVCIFEVKRNKFLVHIFRAKNQGKLQQKSYQQKKHVLREESSKLNISEAHGPRKSLFRSWSSSGSAQRKRLREDSHSWESDASSRLYPGQLHWIANSNRTYYRFGTEDVIRKAAVYQKRLKNPSLLKVVPACSIRSATVLHLTKGFVDEHCPWCDMEILLVDVEHEQWTVQWKAGPYPKISSGFFKFASEHGLQEGDVCIFEVQKKGVCVHPKEGEMERKNGFLVHILRANECLNEEDENQLPKKQHVNNETQEEDVAAEGVADAPAEIPVMGDDIQVQISFQMDAAGVLRPQLSAVMPLDQSQLNQLLVPGALSSALKDLLAAALKKEAVVQHGF